MIPLLSFTVPTVPAPGLSKNERRGKGSHWATQMKATREEWGRAYVMLRDILNPNVAKAPIDPWAGPLALTVVVWYPTARTRDVLGNVADSLAPWLDVLTSKNGGLGVIADDSMAVLPDVRIVARVDRENPRMEWSFEQAEG